MDHLFSDYTLSGLTLRNRVVMAPMTRSRATDTIPDAETALYYRQRASAGLIVTEGAPISRQGTGYLFTPGIYNAAQVAGWKKVTEGVHDAGGKIFSQLWHVGRLSHTSLQQDGASPVGPSSKTAENTTSFAYDEHGTPGAVQASQPRALQTDEVKAIVQDFANAAENARDAGFDGVELHGANGYLIEQFINGGLNDRTDEYGGGTLAGRLRFVLEVVDAVIARIGQTRVGIRMSPFNRIFDMPAFDGEAETWIALARELSARNLAYVHISNRNALAAQDGGMDFIRRFRESYQGTLILAGQYTKDQATQDIRDGLTDLAAFGRPFIANPDLVERMQQGLPLASPDHDTFYGGDRAGYTDYPPINPQQPD